jgi:glycosyltransferase involved in cell wall biosynthesis
LTPLVSIIVPNYNHLPYLPQRLASIAAQTYTHYELILLDDASTDGSTAYLEKYCQENNQVRFYPNAQNSGSPFTQWNKGAKLAQGQYLWFAESDDFADPDFLKKLVPLLEKNPSVGLAYGQSYLVNEKGETLNSYGENLNFIYKSKAWEQDFLKPGPAACRDWLLHHNPIPNASGILIRKSAYHQAGAAPTHMRLNGDWYLYAKILTQHDLAFSAQHLNFFRVHTQTQRVKSRKRAWVYQELITINEYIRQNVENSQEPANEALSEIANWWIGNLPYHSLTVENWRLNRKLYRHFSPYKNDLPWRIFLTYLISYMRDFLGFIQLLKPLKRFRGWLFPGKYWSQ